MPQHGAVVSFYADQVGSGRVVGELRALTDHERAVPISGTRARDIIGDPGVVADLLLPLHLPVRGIHGPKRAAPVREIDNPVDDGRRGRHIAIGVDRSARGQLRDVV